MSTSISTLGWHTPMCSWTEISGSKGKGPWWAFLFSERNHHHQSTAVSLLHFVPEGQTILEDYILPAGICNEKYVSTSLGYVLTAVKLIACLMLCSCSLERVPSILEPPEGEISFPGSPLPHTKAVLAALEALWCKLDRTLLEDRPASPPRAIVNAHTWQRSQLVLF